MSTNELRRGLDKLDRLIECIEDECDTTGPVCHGHDLTDDGECALVTDLADIARLINGGAA